MTSSLLRNVHSTDFTNEHNDTKRTLIDNTHVNSRREIMTFLLLFSAIPKECGMITTCGKMWAVTLVPSVHFLAMMYYTYIAVDPK